MSLMTYLSIRLQLLLQLCMQLNHAQKTRIKRGRTDAQQRKGEYVLQFERIRQKKNPRTVINMDAWGESFRRSR